MKDQSIRKNDKDKKSKEFGINKKGGEGYWKNKMDPIIKISYSSETSVYFYIIYKYWKKQIVLW